MAFRFVYILIVGLLMSACTSNDESFEDRFIEGISQVDRMDLLEKQYVVVMPRIGCMGCISSVEQFMMDSAIPYSEKVGFLLTDIISLKTAVMRFGEDVVYGENVYLDQENSFDFGENLSLYPAILKIDNKRVVNIEYVSPENPIAIDKLISALQ